MSFNLQGKSVRVTISVKNGRHAVKTRFFGLHNPYRGLAGMEVDRLPEAVAMQFGTYPNPHLICSLQACERGLGITQSMQTSILRSLSLFGTAIRDHSLHLQVCLNAMGRNDISAMGCAAAGRTLEKLVAGTDRDGLPRAFVGGMRITEPFDYERTVEVLRSARKEAKDIYQIFVSSVEDLSLSATIGFVARTGNLWADEGLTLKRLAYEGGCPMKRNLLGIYLTAEGAPVMVGPLARLNIALCSKEVISSSVENDLLDLFCLLPSQNPLLNPAAQAAEVVLLVNRALLWLKNRFVEEKTRIGRPFRYSRRVQGVVEAPRGLLSHRLDVDGDGRLMRGAIFLPTEQNRPVMDRAAADLLDALPRGYAREDAEAAVTRLMRAFNPCVDQSGDFIEFEWK